MASRAPLRLNAQRKPRKGSIPPTPATGSFAAILAAMTMAASGAATGGATAITLTGPTTGTSGSASTFTVTANGALSSVVVTPNATGLAGTFSPTTVTLTASSLSGTFTFTPASTGTASISITNNGGLANLGSPISLVAGAASAFSTTFTLASTSAQTAPFTIGHAFKQGDVPSGSGIVVSGATAQATVKNAWPDGSAKFAIIAGTAAVSTTPATITLTSGTASTGTALTLTDLKATGASAVVGCGAFGSVSWIGTDWDAPFQTWVSGHRMSSWLYRKPIGTDPHLVAWLEVRLYVGGAVEVLPWIENGYLLVAAPTNKSTTYTFTLGGTQRYSGAIDLPHHCRTPLLDGTKLSHWLGTDPNVTPWHDTGYMQDSELVPSYRGQVSPTAANVTALVSSYTPMQQGNFAYAGDRMGSGGYASPIGLLPEHDVLYLTTSVSTYASVVRNGYSAGRYAIHYRDETTQRPFRFSSYPNLVVWSNDIADAGASSISDYTPIPSGTTPPLYDHSHSPSMGYMAYLLTGRWYFMEETQFVATSGYFGNVTDTWRNFSDGLLRPLPGAIQTRSTAWKMRALVQCLSATPDDDTTLRNELKASMEANIAYFYNTYVAQANNPFGFIRPDVDYGDTGVWIASPWQQDFFTGAVGYGLALGLPLSATAASQLSAFFHWTARSVVGRLGTSFSPDWWYVNGAVYNITVSTSDSPDFEGGTGPWYASWRAMWDATVASPAASAANWGSGTRSTTEGVLGSVFGGSDSTGYWGNLQPALAYAVRHGVVGAQAAYDRMLSASNWATKVGDGFNDTPVWSVTPERLPAWRRGQAVNEWRQISASAMSLTPPTVFAGGTDPSGAPKLNAWSGLSIDTRSSQVWAPGNGGHGDYYGNEIMRFDLAADAPKWVEVFPSSPASAVDASVGSPRYLDGRPASVHGYYANQFIERHNRAVRVGTLAVPHADAYWDVDGWNINAASGVNGWTAQYEYDPIRSPSITFGAGNLVVSKDPATESIYVWSNNSACRKFVPSASGPTGATGSGGSWSDLGSAPPATFPGYLAASAFDTRRNRIFIGCGNHGEYPASNLGHYYTFDVATGAYTEQALSGAALTTLNASATSPGMVYVSAIDAYLVRLRAVGGQIIKIDASTFACTFITTTGGSSIPATVVNDPTQYESVYSRWLFVPALRGAVYFPEYSANAWFLRLY